MNNPTENMKLTVQDTLDELYNEHLIPFKLTAQKVTSDGHGGFSVPFYDSRIHSVNFCWKNGGPFSEIVRSAVLDRVRIMEDAFRDFRTA